MIELKSSQSKGTFERKTIEFLRTTKNKMGIPFLFENTLKDETKKVTRIFDSSCNVKEPLYVSFNKNLSIIPIMEGDILLKVFYDESGLGISIIRIVSIDKYSNEAEIDVLYRKASDSDTIICNDSIDGLSSSELNRIQKILNTLEKY